MILSYLFTLKIKTFKIFAIGDGILQTYTFLKSENDIKVVPFKQIYSWQNLLKVFDIYADKFLRSIRNMQLLS